MRSKELQLRRPLFNYGARRLFRVNVVPSYEAPQAVAVDTENIRSSHANTAGGRQGFFDLPLHYLIVGREELFCGGSAAAAEREG